MICLRTWTLAFRVSSEKGKSFRENFSFFSFRLLSKMRKFSFFREISKVFLQNAKFSHFFAIRFVRWKIETLFATNSNFYAILYSKPDGKTFEISNFNSLILQNSNWNIKSLPHQVAQIKGFDNVFFYSLFIFFHVYFQNVKAFNMKFRIFVNKK